VSADSLTADFIMSHLPHRLGRLGVNVEGSYLTNQLKEIVFKLCPGLYQTDDESVRMNGASRAGQ